MMERKKKNPLLFLGHWSVCLFLETAPRQAKPLLPSGKRKCRVFYEKNKFQVPGSYRRLKGSLLLLLYPLFSIKDVVTLDTHRRRRRRRWLSLKAFSFFSAFSFLFFSFYFFYFFKWRPPSLWCRSSQPFLCVLIVFSFFLTSPRLKYRLH